MIRAHVLCCGGTGCTSSGSLKIQDAFVREIERQGLADEVKVVQTGCFGLCALGPVVILYPDGTFYSRVTEADVAEIVEELRGEKIDVVLFSEKPEEYIAAALSPASVLEVDFDGERSATVWVDSDQLSLAIGKEGQNVRLAVRLTGYKIDIKSRK